MALNFPNVSVLGLSQNARFFDAGFQYSSFRRLTIAGTVNDLTNGFGITGIDAKIDPLTQNRGSKWVGSTSGG